MFYFFKKENLGIGGIGRVYFDHASATPVRAEALTEFERVTKEYFANPSSIHAEGERSREFLEKLRKDFAFLIRAKKSEVHFVSSSTEANNIFIQGVVKKSFEKGYKPHIITSLAEHSSVLEPVLAMQKLGAEVTFLMPNKFGKYSVDDFKKALQSNTILVAMSSVNSETGTKQDVREIALALQNYSQEKGIVRPYLYIDATQGVEYDTVDVGTLLCDGMTFGSRKLGALGGVALLYVKRNTELAPLIHGGGQEGGVKSGTENLGLIASFYKVASEIISNKSEKENRLQKVIELKKILVEKINSELSTKVEVLSETKIHIDNKPNIQKFYFKSSAPHIILLYVPKILGEEAVLRLDAKGIAVSTSSACSILEGSGSNFLRSLGEFEKAKETVRISFNETNTKAEIDYFVKTLKEIVDKYQPMLN